ncbi:MAG: hypothetical protein M3P24_00245 [Gemmatimonadota bacterium]|nr:hypothetical protein [Gemmatimonadota bacterium]
MTAIRLDTPQDQKGNRIKVGAIFGLGPDRYGFEATRHHRYRKWCSHDTAVFFRKLHPQGGLAELTDEDRQLISDCVEAHTYNIYWYSRALRRERALKWGLFSATTLLLLAIPGSIFWLTADGSTGDSLIGQLGIVITGVIAVQKGVSSWVEARKFEAQFWRASSELKASLYKLQNEQKGKLVVGDTDGTGKLTLSPEFKAALTGATDLARKLVEDETLRYFEGYTVPSVDVSGSLTGPDLAKSIVERFTSPKQAQEQAHRQEADTRRQERRDALRRLSVAISSIASLERLVTDQRQKLGRLPDEEKKLVTAQIHAWNVKLATLQEEKIAAEALLSVGD